MKKVSLLLIFMATCSLSVLAASAGEIGPETITVYSGSTNSTTISFTTAPSGGIITEYQWYSAGTGLAIWLPLLNANEATITFTGLTSSCYYRCKVTIFEGLISTTYTTNTVTVTVLPEFQQGTIQSESMVCYNTGASLSFQTAPTGGEGSYTYQWQVPTIFKPFSTENKSAETSNSLVEKDIIVPISLWANIIGATSSTFNTSPLHGTSKYRCLVNGGAGAAATNEIVIIIDTIKADFVPADTTIFSGDDVQFISKSINADSYKWDFGNGANSIEESPTAFFYSLGGQDVKLIVTSPGGCKDTLLKEDVVIVEEASATDNILSNEPSIFPQPATNYVRFNLPNITEASLVLYSISGQVIMERLIDANSTVSIEALPIGTYIAQINLIDGQTFFKKIVKE